MEQRQRARRAGHDGAAHHPVSGGGRAAGRPDRDPPPGADLVNGTLDQLKRLLPPAKVEYVEKQPTLEDVFFAIVGTDE
jgi:hypothetical protein